MAKLSIIIPAHKDADYIDLTLEALEDQDFQDFNVVIVNDGRDADLEKRIQDHIEAKNYSYPLFYEFIEKGGASKARNFGFNILKNAVDTSKMKYTLFLDSDCQLLPGILQNMVDILDKHADISFVYGDYEYDGGGKFRSRPFNPYVLRTMNYISTMSMMRTEIFKGFNEDLEYFQDWDLFYNLAKEGHKGYYLKETLFTTQKPDKDSISGIQIPLKDKCKVFRECNEIPHADLVVTSFGCPLQAEQRAEMLDADYAGTSQGASHGIYPTNLQFENWKYTYIVGAFNDPLSALVNHLSVVVGRPIIHFVGTDVFQLYEKHSTANLERIKERLDAMKAILLVNSPRLQDEMLKMGFRTALVYTPIFNAERYTEARNLDSDREDYTVGVYYSDSPNMNFFNTANPFDNKGGESNLYLMWEVAKAMPHIKFKFFGGKAKFTTANVEFCGKIKNEDMPEFIANCDTIVRTTIHDSLPQLPVQFMLAGRRVITSSNFKEGDLGLSFQDIIHFEDAKSEVIDKIQEARLLGDLDKGEYEKVLAFVGTSLHPTKYKETIEGIMHDPSIAEKLINKQLGEE